MKRLMTLLILTGLTTGLYAEEEERSWKADVGIGLMAERSPYKGVGTEGSPIPVLDLKYKKLYLRGTELGYEAFETERFKVSAFADFMGGYEVEGGDLDKGYQDIDDRDTQFEGGLELTYKLPEDYELTARIALGSEGNRYTLEGSKLYFIGEKTIIRPSVYAAFNDSSYTDYYFGVTKDEAAKNEGIKKEYNAGSSQEYGIELMAEHDLNESFALVGFGGVKYLSGEIDDSPIVDNNFIYEVGAGFKYKF
ncbi:membrane protein [Propionigenium maris DSM 9537]|uniref:Membrane protein n=1 Tax=Propionigenium maris DSM 9537 TaxID=1123000 RepID=A0A9W6GH69_9FUSO|nr:MipA/OmpV family protein [Propionigenium maris]GLI55178.1 membrane protein [Propionigenium maris DSM 9537]